MCIYVLFECGFTLFVLLRKFVGFARGGFIGVDGVLMLGLIHGKILGALSGLLFSPLELAPSHTASFSSFQQKYLPDSTRPHVYRHQFLRLALPV